MIALDIDGTLLGYDSYTADTPTVNLPLIRQLAKVTRQVALVTNQGGLPFGVMNMPRRATLEAGYVDTPVSLIPKMYPRPEFFYRRYLHLMEILHDHDIEDVALRVSCFHPKAPVAAIEKAAAQVRDLFRPHLFDWKIYTTERARKPNPFMLHSVEASIYYGDSDEDEQAAQAAGIPFVRVERFR